MNTYIGASLIRSDSATLPEGATIEHRYRTHAAKEVHIRLYQGMASKGYSSNYQRVPTYWLEADIQNPEGKVVKHKCWSFSGKKGAERADDAYMSVKSNVAESFPGAAATFPTQA